MSRYPLLFVLLVAAALPLATGASDLEARLREGAALAARGERVAARALFEQLAAAHPHRPEPLNDLAALAAAAGDLPRARALLERALATHPNFRTVHDNLATVYAAEAAAAYRKALPLDASPTEHPALVMLTDIAPPRAQVAAVPVPMAPTMTRPTAPRGPLRDLFDDRAWAAFAAVDGWARAWTARDVAGYLAAYAPEYLPPDGLTRAAWEAQRAERIRAPQRIAITLEQRHLTFDTDGKRARMTFTQHYRSDRFNGDSFKTLTLVERGGRWLISAERTGR